MLYGLKYLSTIASSTTSCIPLPLSDTVLMRTIEHDCNKITAKILDEVFHHWIKGQGQKDGKKTNTWKMLVKYLKHAELITLADEIESVLQFCAEKTAHVDDDECNHEYGEHEHDMPLEIKSTLQYLISMLAVVIYIVGPGAVIFRYKSEIAIPIG